MWFQLVITMTSFCGTSRSRFIHGNVCPADCLSCLRGFVMLCWEPPPNEGYFYDVTFNRLPVTVKTDASLTTVLHFFSSRFIAQRLILTGSATFFSLYSQLFSHVLVNESRQSVPEYSEARQTTVNFFAEHCASKAWWARERRVWLSYAARFSVMMVPKATWSIDWGKFKRCTLLVQSLFTSRSNCIFVDCSDSRHANKFQAISRNRKLREWWREKASPQLIPYYLFLGYSLIQPFKGENQVR